MASRIHIDVSGSMDFHSTRLLKVLHLAQNTVPDARVFAFSTGLTRMERYLRGRSLRNAAREVSRNVEIWSSGTRIGAALGRLLREYSADLRADTVVVIISDGWEVGELEVLDENLAKMRRRVSKIVWLNPLADDPGYLPKTLGMQTALPYVDLFAPSLPEARAISGAADAEAAARWLEDHGAAKVVVKLGADGCYVGGGIGHVEPVQVDAIDATGAGDAFVAGLLYGVLAGWPLEDAARLANAAGALATTAVGAGDGVRGLDETVALAGLE